MDSSKLLTVTEAADVLGVSPRHVRRLADEGAVTKIARGVIDRESVDVYLAAERQSRTRAWSEHTAWGAVALLSAQSPDWLGVTQTSRLRHSLQGITGVDELITRMRGRSQVRRFDAHRAALPRLRRLIAMSDQGMLGLSGLAEDVVDGYVDADRVPELVRTWGLRPAVRGPVTLRLVTFGVDRVRPLITTRVVAALDAAVSVDPRSRGVGGEVLEEILSTRA